jgi:GNAT superfamily N-acetyltransferase
LRRAALIPIHKPLTRIYTDRMLESAIDSNTFDFYAYASEATGLPVVRGQGFSYVAFRPSPWANTVFDLNFPPAKGNPSSLREGIIGGSIPNKVRLGPSSRPLDVDERLAKAGFIPGIVNHGMMLELSTRSRVAPPRALSLSPLSEPEDFLAFSGIVAANLFAETRDAAPAFARVLASLGRDRAFGVLGRAEGGPVSAAFAFIDFSGVGGIYFVATEAGMRGRGYAAATVDAVLEELERRGRAFCILHATPLGRPVYERLGFKTVCPLCQYRLPAQEEQDPAAAPEDPSSSHPSLR